MCPFVEGTPRLGIHLPHRRRDESGDQAVPTPPRAAARRPREDTLESLVEYGCSVLSVLESSRSGDPRKERFDRVTERLRAPKDRSQCAEGIRRDRSFGRFGPQPARMNEVRPP